ncbi:MAG: hypothetical protein ABW217_03915 [Polyangiaceae bacterium]
MSDEKKSGGPPGWFYVAAPVALAAGIATGPSGLLVGIPALAACIAKLVQSKNELDELEAQGVSNRAKLAENERRMAEIDRLLELNAEKLRRLGG